MPDLWVDVDTAVIVPVNVLPLVDDTDFKSIETAVVYNSGGMALTWNFQTAGGVVTGVAVTPTTAGVYDWSEPVADKGMYAIELPASGGASANNDTEGVGWFTGVATGVLPWRGPTIGFRAAALNDALIDSAWSATRGLAGTALPAAAADAVGGLPISDAGGLDMDAMNAAAILLTAARAGVLTDWINGGRLDLILDTLALEATLTADRSKYAIGAVWIGPAANTNTVSYIDGIITNPVSTLAAAKTIADALKLRRFYTTRTGTVQIGADYVGYDFGGDAWSCTTTGGSRDVSASYFHHAKVVGGTYASTSAESHWDYCEFSDGISVAAIHATVCSFAGTLTLNAAGNYDFVDCASVVAGAATPVFAVPAGTVNISFRRWSGGISITGITANTTISIDMVSGGTVTLAGADGVVEVRGLAAGITDNRTGTPTLGQNAAVNMTKINAEADTALADYDPPTNTEMTSAFTEIKGATWASGTDTMEAVRDRGDTAWITATSCTVSDKTGFKLASDGLDSVAVTAPAGVAANFREMIVQVWRRFFKKSTLTATELKTYDDAGTGVATTQTVSDDSTTQTQGGAS